MLRLRALAERLRASLWFIPGLFALAAVVGAATLGQVDQRLAEDAEFRALVFGGTPDGARGLLSTIAQAMLAFTGLVFSITMLVLQQASSQLSPRVMRTFLRDRANQTVLGLFVATFVFTLLVLLGVRSSGGADPEFVPAISTWVAFALLLASVAAFIYYIDHMAHAIRAVTVIASIAAETADAIERVYPERVGAPANEGGAPGAFDDATASTGVPAPRAGVLVAVDEGALLEAVGEGDRRLALLRAVGDFAPADGPLVRAWGEWDEPALEAVRGAVTIGDERTLTQDAAFGFRQLVDIALRALSPGINDPTTAVQALDRIHDLLRRLAAREFPSPIRSDTTGRPRLRLRRPGWDDYVRLGVEEIMEAGRAQPQVARRLRSMLEDLATVAPEARRPVLRRALAQLPEPEEWYPQGDSNP